MCEVDKTWFISCSCSVDPLKPNEPSEYGSGPGGTSMRRGTPDSFPLQTGVFFSSLCSLAGEAMFLGSGKYCSFSVCIHI